MDDDEEYKASSGFRWESSNIRIAANVPPELLELPPPSRGGGGAAGGWAAGGARRLATQGTLPIPPLNLKARIEVRSEDPWEEALPAHPSTAAAAANHNHNHNHASHHNNHNHHQRSSTGDSPTRGYGHSDGDESPPPSARGTRGGDGGGGGGGTHGGGSSAAASASGASDGSCVGSRQRQRYGAWYVPPKEWKMVYGRSRSPTMTDGPSGSPLAAESSAPYIPAELSASALAIGGVGSAGGGSSAVSGDGGGGGESEAERAGREAMALELGVSYTARAYKEHLRARHLRPPAALKRVSTPTEEQIRQHQMVVARAAQLKREQERLQQQQQLGDPRSARSTANGMAPTASAASGTSAAGYLPASGAAAAAPTAAGRGSSSNGGGGSSYTGHFAFAPRRLILPQTPETPSTEAAATPPARASSSPATTLGSLYPTASPTATAGSEAPTRSVSAAASTRTTSASASPTPLTPPAPLQIPTDTPRSERAGSSQSGTGESHGGTARSSTADAASTCTTATTAVAVTPTAGGGGGGAVRGAADWVESLDDVMAPALREKIRQLLVVQDALLAHEARMHAYEQERDRLRRVRQFANSDAAGGNGAGGLRGSRRGLLSMMSRQNTRKSRASAAAAAATADGPHAAFPPTPFSGPSAAAAAAAMAAAATQEQNGHHLYGMPASRSPKRVHLVTVASARGHKAHVQEGGGGSHAEAHAHIVAGGGASGNHVHGGVPELAAAAAAADAAATAVPAAAAAHAHAAAGSHAVAAAAAAGSLGAHGAMLPLPLLPPPPPAATVAVVPLPAAPLEHHHHHHHHHQHHHEPLLSQRMPSGSAGGASTSACGGGGGGGGSGVNSGLCSAGNSGGYDAALTPQASAASMHASSSSTTRSYGGTCRPNRSSMRANVPPPRKIALPGAVGDLNHLQLLLDKLPHRRRMPKCAARSYEGASSARSLNGGGGGGSRSPTSRQRFNVPLQHTPRSTSPIASLAAGGGGGGWGVDAVHAALSGFPVGAAAMALARLGYGCDEGLRRSISSGRRRSPSPSASMSYTVAGNVSYISHASAVSAEPSAATMMTMPLISPTEPRVLAPPPPPVLPGPDEEGFVPLAVSVVKQLMPGPSQASFDAGGGGGGGGGSKSGSGSPRRGAAVGSVAAASAAAGRDLLAPLRASFGAANQYQQELRPMRFSDDPAYYHSRSSLFRGGSEAEALLAGAAAGGGSGGGGGGGSNPHGVPPSLPELRLPLPLHDASAHAETSFGGGGDDSTGDGSSGSHSNGSGTDGTGDGTGGGDGEGGDGGDTRRSQDDAAWRALRERRRLPPEYSLPARIAGPAPSVREGGGAHSFAAEHRVQGGLLDSSFISGGGAAAGGAAAGGGGAGKAATVPPPPPALAAALRGSGGGGGLLPGLGPKAARGNQSPTKAAAGAAAPLGGGGGYPHAAVDLFALGLLPNPSLLRASMAATTTRGSAVQHRRRHGNVAAALAVLSAAGNLEPNPNASAVAVATGMDSASFTTPAVEFLGLGSMDRRRGGGAYSAPSSPMPSPYVHLRPHVPPGSPMKLAGAAEAEKMQARARMGRAGALDLQHMFGVDVPPTLLQAR